MLVPIVAVLVGLVLLTRAADVFVEGAARLSAALNVSPVIIGAVVIGFGTSAPEMVVSAIASAQGKLDIAIGNIIGSNTANLSLIFGISALLCVMRIDSSILRREAPLSAAAVALFAVLVQGGLTRTEGGILAVAMAAALAYLFLGPETGSAELATEVDEYVEEGEPVALGREAMRTLLGLLVVIAGAQLTVEGASEIADQLDLGEGFVGLTLVAIGTSLPELVTSVAAARKGEEELIVGNLLGSNLFNSVGVGAIAGLVGPGPLDDGNLAGIGTVVMLVVVFGAWLFMTTGRRVTRLEAVALLGGYAAAVPLLA